MRSATCGQFEDSLRKAIQAIAKKLNLTAQETAHEVNCVVMDRDIIDKDDPEGRRIIYHKGDATKAIVRFDSEKLFFAMMNLEEDGSKRVTYEGEDIWEAEIGDDVWAQIDAIKNVEDDGKTIRSWADIVEEEEAIRIDNVPPLVETEKEPLYQGLWYKPTKEQIEKQKRLDQTKAKDGNEVDKEIVQRGFYDEKNGRQYFTVRRFSVPKARGDKKETRSFSSLVGTVPPEFTEKDVFQLFSKFASTNVTWKPRDGGRESPYPKITFPDVDMRRVKDSRGREFSGRQVHVDFQLGTHDGAFAEAMRSKVPIKSKDGVFPASFRLMSLGIGPPKDEVRQRRPGGPPQRNTRGGFEQRDRRAPFPSRGNGWR